MPKLSYLGILIFVILLGSCSIRRAGLPARGLPKLAEDSSSRQEAFLIHSFVESLAPQTFSGALVVARNRSLILANGYGLANWEEQQPFEVQTISHTAALAKQFTAAAILKLQAQGRLKVEDSLGIFFNDIPADKRGIKLRQLLTHRSGLPREFAEAAGLPLLKEEFLARLWQEPLQFSPGTGYLYSDVAYRLLAAVVEQASGLGYEEYLHNEFFKPAHMPNTGYVLPQFQAAYLAREQGEQFSEERLIPDYKSLAPALWHILGSSGMLSNAEDIYRWSHLLLEGNLIPEEEQRMLWEDREGVPDGQPAYGWELRYSPDSTPLMMHNSRVGNFVSQLLFYPKERVQISLLANQANKQVEILGLQLGRMLLEPQYTPAPVPYREQKFVRIPQGKEAESLRALLQFVQKEQETEAHTMLENYYSPAFRKGNTEQVHMQALKNLQRRLAHASIERIGQEWPFYSLTLYAPVDNIWYRLRVGVEPQAPYKITSIALETTDPF